MINTVITQEIIAPKDKLLENNKRGSVIGKEVLMGALKWSAIGGVVLGVLALVLYLFKR